MEMTMQEINLKDPHEQLELLRFIQILDKRIQELEAEMEKQHDALASQKSMLRSLQKQKEMMACLNPLEVEGGGEQWIHINECSKYEELPQPNTLRQWIREGKLEEGVDFKRVGVRKKIFIDATRIVAK